MEGSNETGVTTQAKITAKLGNVDKNEAYFALVLLNNGSGTDEKVNLPAVSTKYSEWNIADNAKDKFAKYDKGFYMANAPLHNNINKRNNFSCYRPGQDFPYRGSGIFLAKLLPTSM